LTGEKTEYSFHLAGFSEEEQELIFNYITHVNQ